MAKISSNKLYLFTNRFPFMGGETFLETEITYLSQAFDHVIIYPTEWGEEYFGILPVNVSVHKCKTEEKARIRRLLSEYGFIIFKYFFKVLVFSRNRFKHLFQLTYVWNYLIGIIQLANSLKNQFESDMADTVFYSYWYNDWASALVVLKHHGKKLNLVVRAHGYDYDELQSPRGFFPFREAEVQRINKIVQISEYGMNKMKNTFRRANIELLRLGVDDCGNNPVPESEKPYRIVSCSSFVPLKRIDLIVDVLSMLNVPFEWVHIGSGEGVENMIGYANTKLDPSRFFFKGQLKNTDVMSYYKESPIDLFINLSELEGIPVSLMEAISFGIPVVGCAVCGVPEIVNQNTGLLLPKEIDPLFVSQQITLFLKNKSRDSKYRQGVKDFWSKEYNAVVNYFKITKELQSI